MKGIKSYLKFTEILDTGKTKVFQVDNIGCENIGFVRWYPNWRRYVFKCYSDLILDLNCLNEISSFIDSLMKDRVNERD